MNVKALEDLGDVTLREHQKQFASREHYFSRAEAFLAMCRGKLVTPSVQMNSGEEMRTIHEERGDQLP